MSDKIEVPDHVQEAIRTLIRWAGDDPDREGLLDTPKRVGRAWKEYCQGYEGDPGEHLSRVFEEVGGYDEIVLLKDIPFQSHCEHHMAPIIGKAAIAYLPTDRVVGISKLARVLRGFARLLQEGNLFIVLAATGLFVQFGLQAIINMASTLHLMPTKGMTLPFISYGGSSMLSLGLAMGMALALTRRRYGGGGE